MIRMLDIGNVNPHFSIYLSISPPNTHTNGGASSSEPYIIKMNFNKVNFTVNHDIPKLILQSCGAHLFCAYDACLIHQGYKERTACLPTKSLLSRTRAKIHEQISSTHQMTTIAMKEGLVACMGIWPQITQGI